MADFQQELKFPVKWHYKIITDAGDTSVQERINQALAQHHAALVCEPGNYSSSRKYLTFKATVEFHNREDMAQMSETLAKIPGVKYLI